MAGAGRGSEGLSDRLYANNSSPNLCNINVQVTVSFKLL